MENSGTQNSKSMTDFFFFIKFPNHAVKLLFSFTDVAVEEQNGDDRCPRSHPCSAWLPVGPTGNVSQLQL